jgi:pimeloyl-ACP methyl ester carboxylesterase
VTPLTWTACEDGFECATLTVPLDYNDTAGPKIDLAVIRKPAANPEQRIGSLLTNPGGPGGSGVDFVRSTATPDGLFASLNTQFDIVSWDPRGTAGSAPINCFSDSELEAFNARQLPFPTLANRDAVLADSRAFSAACVANNDSELLSSISTETSARDMDQLRRALGEDKVSYIGFSYGTYLGATYSSLFPNNIRALVLDGAVDPTQYANQPIAANITQAFGFETALDRYFNNFCGTACNFTGGKAAWKDLVNKLQTTPLNTGVDTARPVNGTSVINATSIVLYSRGAWPVLDVALAEAAAGDGRRLQRLSDIALGRNSDGTYDPGAGAFAAITAVDQNYPQNIVYQDFLQPVYTSVSPSFGGASFWASLAGGYSAFEWPVEATARFSGPFRNARSNTPAVVIGTTFDPATPFIGSVAMTRQLGNARLLTMNGDGHTAYSGNSACIDAAVEAYLVSLTVPAANKVCQQDPEAAPPPAAAQSGSSTLPGEPVTPEEPATPEVPATPEEPGALTQSPSPATVPTTAPSTKTEPKAESNTDAESESEIESEMEMVEGLLASTGR